MKITCNIIRDILPLYAEDMVCEETKELVDEHLGECEACRAELEALKKKDVVPISTDTTPMEHIRRTIRKRQVLTTLCVILTIVSLIWSGMVYMSAPMNLPAEKVIEGVELREDGGLAIDFARGHRYMAIGISGGNDKYISATYTRYDWAKGRIAERKYQDMTKEELEAHIREMYRCDAVTQQVYDWFYDVQSLYIFRNEKGDECIEFQPECTRNSIDQDVTWTFEEPEYDLWYLDAHGKPEALLWNGGDGEFCGEELINDPAAELIAGLFYGSLGVMVVAFGLAWLLRNKKWKTLPLVIGFLAAGLVLHILLFTGVNFTDYSWIRLSELDNRLIVTMMLLTVTALLWLYRHDVNKKGSF